MSNEILAEITNYMQQNFEIGAPTNMYLALTGEPYVTVTTGGIKEQGGRIRALAADIEKAKELFLYEFDKYVNGKSGTIYWRRKPEFKEQRYWNEPQERFDVFCTITARLLVSDKPKMEIHELESYMESLR